MGPGAVAGGEFHRGRRPRREDHDQHDGQQHEPPPALAAPGTRPCGLRATAIRHLGIGRFPVGRPVLGLPPPGPARAGLLLRQPKFTWRRRRGGRRAAPSATAPPRLPQLLLSWLPRRQSESVVRVAPGTRLAVPCAMPWAGPTVGHRRAERIRARAAGASRRPVVSGSPRRARRGGEPGRAGTRFRIGPRRLGGGAWPGTHLGRVFRPGPRPEPGVGSRAKPAILLGI